LVLPILFYLGLTHFFCQRTQLVKYKNFISVPINATSRVP